MASASLFLLGAGLPIWAQARTQESAPSSPGEHAQVPSAQVTDVILATGDELWLDAEGSERLRWMGKGWKPSGEIEWGPLPDPAPPIFSSAQVDRWEGKGTVGNEVGDALVYRLPSGEWGRLVVLHRAPDWIRVEHAALAKDQDWILASQFDLRGSSEPTLHRLQWNAQPGSRYRIDRWIVGQNSLAQELATVEDGHWIDADPPRGALVEYTVTALDGPPTAPERIRLLRQEQPMEWAYELETGLGIDLLTGAVHGPDPHIQIQQVVGNRVVLRCAENSPL